MPAPSYTTVTVLWSGRAIRVDTMLYPNGDYARRTPVERFEFQWAQASQQHRDALARVLRLLADELESSLRRD